MNDNPALVNQIVNQLATAEAMIAGDDALINGLKTELKTMANEWQKSMDELAEAKKEVSNLCDRLLSVVADKDTVLSMLRYCYDVQMSKFPVPIMTFEQWGKSVQEAIATMEKKS
jgi:hypothetical protein